VLVGDPTSVSPSRSALRSSTTRSGTASCTSSWARTTPARQQSELGEAKQHFDQAMKINGGEAPADPAELRFEVLCAKSDRRTSRSTERVSRRGIRSGGPSVEPDRQA